MSISLLSYFFEYFYEYFFEQFDFEHFFEYFFEYFFELIFEAQRLMKPTSCVECVVPKFCTVDKETEGYKGSQCGEDEGSRHKAFGFILSPGNDKAARGNEEGRKRGQNNQFCH